MPRKKINPAPTEKIPTKENLGGFIEENEKLITVLGVFVALSLFARSLPFQLVSYSLSFLFLVATILIWFELMVKIYSHPKITDQLWAFQGVLTAALLIMIGYLLLDYRNIWRQFLYYPLAFVLTIGFREITKKSKALYEFLLPYPGKRFALQSVIGLTIFLIIMGLILLLSIKISTYINDFLDYLNITVSKPLP